MYLLYCVFAILPCLYGFRTCTLSVSVADWLTNNSDRCEIIRGNFILDGAANNLSSDIYSSFSFVRRIEGCIFIANYEGSRNLSFFSALEEVICNETEAGQAGLQNVIHVVAPFLYSMGFDSLVTVEGPGRIILSYEEGSQERYLYQTIRRRNTDELSRQCFSKKELIFLMKQPLFTSKMYHPCDVDDPCQRLELHVKNYNFTSIPEDCDFFVGMVCIAGPYDQAHPVLNKFKNMTAIIGQLHVSGTLWNDMSVFSNLQHIRYYELPKNFHDSCGQPSGYNSSYGEGTQFIQAGLSRFLRNFTMASLKPAITVSISDPFLPTFPKFKSVSGSKMQIGFDEHGFNSMVDDKICTKYFKGYSCNFAVEYPVNQKADESKSYRFLLEFTLFNRFLTIIGLLFIIRSLILYFSSKTRQHLPKSQYLIILMIILITLQQLQSCLFDERTFQTQNLAIDKEEYLFSTITDPLLFHPFFRKFYINFLAAWKHAALIVLICCYLDVIIFCRNVRWSKYFVVAVILISIAILIWFYQHLYNNIRVFRPTYKETGPPGGIGVGPAPSGLPGFPRELPVNSENSGAPSGSQVTGMDSGTPGTPRGIGTPGGGGPGSLPEQLPVVDTKTAAPPADGGDGRGLPEDPSASSETSSPPDGPPNPLGGMDWLAPPTRPHPEMLFISFVMNTDGVANFTKSFPVTSALNHIYDKMVFAEGCGPKEMHMDMSGYAFPDYCSWCDLTMLVVFITFHILQKIKYIELLDNFNILLLLYLQLSMFRIRAFILNSIMWSLAPILHYSDEHPLNQILFYPISLYSAYVGNLGGFDYNIYWNYELFYGWFLRFLEKSPAITFVLVSIYCWKFMRYHRYLGLAMLLRKKKRRQTIIAPTIDSSSLTATVQKTSLV